MKKHILPEIPTTQALEAELQRVRDKNHFHAMLRRTACILIIVAAAAILVATLFLPVMRIYGTSMTPTIDNGDIVVAVKTTDVSFGDVIAFYCNNKVLVKRVIGCAGDWIDVDKNGVVTVNGSQLDEPYVSSRALGNTNIELPYQVPDNKFFVMGDHRESSIDSRNTEVGCVGQDQIVGRVVWRLWPLAHISMIR